MPSDIRRSVSLIYLAIAFTSIALLFQSIPVVGQENATEPVARDPDWSLLRFGPDRHVTAVRLRIGDFGVWAKKGQEGFVDLTTTDGLVCKKVEDGLWEAMRHAPAPRGIAATGNEPYGELQITTNTDQFIVGLYSQFVLSGLYQNNRNGFVSWTPAKVTSELYEKLDKKPLSEARFKLLSGEFSIDHAKQKYDKYGKPESKDDPGK